PQRDAERLTGLLVGGIGALALVNRPFEVCIERAALDHEWVLVNGGRRGLNLRVAVADVIRLTGAPAVDAGPRAASPPHRRAAQISTASTSRSGAERGRGQTG